MITAITAPLLAGILITLVRRKPAWIALTGAFISLAATFRLLLPADGGAREIIVAAFPGMPFLLKTDPLNLFLLLLVILVACFIFIYAVGYMKDEKGGTWFWAGMSLFLGAMNALVLAADWILFVLCWELVGLASYLLIAAWHWREEARTGAAKAFMITRITDMGLYLGVFSILLSTGSAIGNDGNIPLFAAIMLLIAVMGKSAQIPFQSWLSGAMAGPTPVSALLHSATIVAAGVVLLIKIFPLLPEAAFIWIGSVGAATILLAGLTALFSSDLKQMLAASTSSQLGFMLLAIGAGSPGAAAAHLAAHAFMKSSLFLGAGIFQKACDSTDLEEMRGAGRKLKVGFAGFAIAAIALAGIPPLIGFWSKDAALATAFHSQTSDWYFSAALAGALLTAMYMGKAVSILWNGGRKVFATSFTWMNTGLICLGLAVAAGGFFLEPVMNLAGLELPKNEVAMYTGLGAAITGLVAGWFLPSEASGKAAALIRDHYRFRGGFGVIITEAANRVAFLSERLETGLLRVVLATGNAFLMLASLIGALEAKIIGLTERTGNLNVRLSGYFSRIDETGIDGFIEKLTGSLQALGDKGRLMQSGLAHRELMWSVIGLIGFLIAMSFL